MNQAAVRGEGGPYDSVGTTHPVARRDFPGADRGETSPPGVQRVVRHRNRTSKSRGSFLLGCMGESASRCGLLMIPIMVVVGGIVLLGLLGPLSLMPILLPILLGLFIVQSTYFYLRGLRACGSCGKAARQDWRACPYCAEPLPEQDM